MDSIKGKYAQEFAAQKNIPFVALDYTTMGKSSGTLKDFRTGACLNDIQDIIGQTIKDKPFIIVASSFGGGLAFHIAKTYAPQVKGVLGISIYPDMLNDIWERLFTQKHRDYLMGGGVFEASEETKGNYFSYPMFTDAFDHQLLDKQIAYDGEVVLLQGDQDKISPPDLAFKIKDLLTAEYVQIHVLKGYGHSFEKEHQLAHIGESLAALINRVVK
jgi:pimeloyl-ACP methyl ester carboxylesterase